MILSSKSLLIKHGVSDVFRLKWSDFQNYRLHYSMGKNDKGGSLKIPDKAVAILKHYEQFKEHTEDLIFPELKGVDLSDDFIAQRTIAFKPALSIKFCGCMSGQRRRSTRNWPCIFPGIRLAVWRGMRFRSRCCKNFTYIRKSRPQWDINQANFIHKDADDALDAVINNATKTSEISDIQL